VSVYATTAVWKHSRATGAARLVLLALADEASSEGLVDHYKRSRAHLMAKTLVSERQVTRAIADLVALGELVVTERGTGRTVSSYAIVLPGLDAMAGQGCHGDTPAPTTTARQGRHSGTPLSKRKTRSIPSLPGIPLAAAAADGPAPDPITALADSIARDEWERRKVKPVAGFMAMRARIIECLDAGHTEEELRRVLPTMKVFSQNAFDFMLNGGPGKRGKPVVDDSAQRALPAGKVEL